MCRDCSVLLPIQEINDLSLNTVEIKKNDAFGKSEVKYLSEINNADEFEINNQIHINNNTKVFDSVTDDMKHNGNYFICINFLTIYNI